MAAEGKFFSAEDCVEAFVRSIKVGRIPTNIRSIDNALGGGLPHGQVVGIVGGTGSGKSELIRHIRHSVRDCGVLHVDVELGASQITERELCQRGGVGSDALQKGTGKNAVLSDVGKQAAADFIESSRHITLWQPTDLATKDEFATHMATTIRELKTQSNFTHWLVIFDSIQRLSHGFGPPTDMRIGVHNFMVWADLFSRAEDVAILATSEKSRSVNEKLARKKAEETGSAAGAESRAIEYVAYAQFVLWPQHQQISGVKGADEEGTRGVEVQLTKSRRNAWRGFLEGNIVFQHPYWRMWWTGEEDMGIRDDVKEILTYLDDGESHTIADISKGIRRQKAATGVVVKRLEETGQIVRTKGGFALKKSEEDEDENENEEESAD